MATILLSAAGAAVGGSIGGTLMGLSMVAVGRFAGAAMGRVIDQRLMGQGSEVVETGRIDRFRLTGSGEGDAIGQVFGRMRIGGQMIWATHFKETSVTTGGGKGGPSKPKTRDYSYSIGLAIGLCQGEIGGVARVWADGVEVAVDDLNMRIYTGSRDQLPDPLIEAVEGAGQVPAYRGTAYVVMEDLDLAAFGNRVPQFSFEVLRPDQAQVADQPDPAHLVRAVAMMPGSGEYALATTPVTFSQAPGVSQSANVNSASNKADFSTSLDRMVQELPHVGATSLIVSWFGDDLRCGECTIRPKVEQSLHDAPAMPWRVAGLTRTTATAMATEEDRPIYGGTPTDQSVIEAITRLHETGQEVMYYPFILMDQLPNNGRTDPWSGATDQPRLPWRGRITTSAAPGQNNSPDGTAAADAQVAAFFGTAQASDFVISGQSVTYSGPDEWRYNRFVLHQAALCKAAGGVGAFCIGSEMRGLTQIRGAAGFPAVAQLRNLAHEVRAILGPHVKIGYAADWSEYFGYQPSDGTNDRYFHLDPLWADDDIDFIGIDNYMPLSDWRDGRNHADADWGTIYNLDYLKSNIEGGEGYDWYYHSSEAKAAQIRTPITDEAESEPWVWRYKDIRNWWSNPHHDRINGIRQAVPTGWVPQSKPIWFTELGCAAVDKATNEPNKFVDPKSSESSLPYGSDGRRDELIQMQYLKAMLAYWGDPVNNPISQDYGAPMIDMTRAFVWAWDARPYPQFPGNRDLWSDAANYARGHWVSGRMSARSLASVVAEICTASGLVNFDVSRLYGYVRGYGIADVTDARAALQPLMLRYGFDAVERDGVLRFVTRDGVVHHHISPDSFAVSDEIDGAIEHLRASDADMAGRIRLRFIETDGDYETIAEEAVLPDEQTHSVAASDMPIVMTRAEARQVAERMLIQSRVARDTLRFALPPSMLTIGAGDVVDIADGDQRGQYRVDQVEHGPFQIIDAVRIEEQTYVPADMDETDTPVRAHLPALPVFPLFLDLPLLTGDELPHAPHLALTAMPWPGAVAVYESATDQDFAFNALLGRQSVIGQLETPLFAAPSGRIDYGPAVQVKILSGALQTQSIEALLAGGNVVAIGDGSPDNWEVLQFTKAELIAPDTYLLSERLRGQLGTDALMPDVWPIGSYLVVLNAAVEQIELAASTRGVSRSYRIGPAQKGYADPSYVAIQTAFAGNGLRPYAPAHLTIAELPSGDKAVTWIRRTRSDGDSWDGIEVPLNEETESYLLRVKDGPTILREVITGTPNWVYSAADQTGDGATPGHVVTVAQISARYGPGPAARVSL